MLWRRARPCALVGSEVCRLHLVVHALGALSARLDVVVGAGYDDGWLLVTPCLHGSIGCSQVGWFDSNHSLMPMSLYPFTGFVLGSLLNSTAARCNLK